jgi:hypothetical protein
MPNPQPGPKPKAKKKKQPIDYRDQMPPAIEAGPQEAVNTDVEPQQDLENAEGFSKKGYPPPTH